MQTNLKFSEKFPNAYSNNKKTVEWEDDIKAIIKWILSCSKANNFTNKLLIHLLSVKGLLINTIAVPRVHFTI